QLQYIMESEEIRRSMEPVELIKRVKEIEQEAYLVPEQREQKSLKSKLVLSIFQRDLSLVHLVILTAKE
ncbi:hypothetical protein MKW92_015607, partial [Papaver armeniacum]